MYSTCLRQVHFNCIQTVSTKTQLHLLNSKLDGDRGHNSAKEKEMLEVDKVIEAIPFDKLMRIFLPCIETRDFVLSCCKDCAPFLLGPLLDQLLASSRWHKDLLTEKFVEKSRNLN